MRLSDAQHCRVTEHVHVGEPAQRRVGRVGDVALLALAQRREVTAELAVVVATDGKAALVNCRWYAQVRGVQRVDRRGVDWLVNCP